jgi:hypothetical protein
MRALEAELAMGAETHQFQDVLIGLAIDQDEIGPDVAVAVIGPIPAQRMVTIFVR